MAITKAIEKLRSPLSTQTVGMDTTAEEGDPPSKDNQETKSWVKAVQRKQVLTKYEINVSVKEGKQSVQVPSEIVEKASPFWEDFVIAKFLDTAPHIAKVHMILNKIWTFGDKNQKLDVYEIDSTTMRVRIVSDVVKEKVVKRGMWNIMGVPMVVSKWCPEESAEMANLVPLWVHLTNVPLSMYAWEGLSFMTSTVGIPDRLHPETIACSNFSIAKVFVKADLTKELPQKITFTIQGEEVTVEYKYPWLPTRCLKCKKWGHYETFCALSKKEKVEEQKENGSLVQVGEGTFMEKRSEIVGREESKEIEGSKERVDENPKNMEGEKEVQLVERKEDNWEKVSSEKVGRSPKQVLQYGEVIIATSSRFSALSNSGENGEEIEEEEEEEEMDEMQEEGEIEVLSQNIVVEEMMEGSIRRKKSGRPTQTLPRLSKTNHRVVNVASEYQKDMKRGSRKLP